MSGHIAVFDTVKLDALVFGGDGNALADAHAKWSIGRSSEEIATLNSTGPLTADLSFNDQVSVVVFERFETTTGPVVGRLELRALERRTHVFVWSRDKGFSTVFAPLGREFSVSDVNDAGEVVGALWGEFDGWGYREPFGFVWSAAKGIRQIPFEGFPTSINESGVIAGVHSSDRSFVWDQREGPTLLAASESGSTVYASAINSSGAVAGTTTGANSSAFRWTASRGLQSLPGLSAPATRATDINDTGEILGYEGTWEPADGPFAPYRVLI